MLAKYLGTPARLLPVISGLMACHLFGIATAGKIQINRMSPRDAPNGVRTVVVVDSPNSNLCLEGVTAGGSVVSHGCGTTNAQGGFIFDLSTTDTSNWQSLRIVQSGGETWEGVTKPGKYDSNEQKEKDKNKVPGSFQERVNDLPFQFLPNVGSDEDGPFAQIDIINTSLLHAYDFTTLKLYKGLSPIFWQTDQFDSPAALATGSFQWDFVVDNGFAILQTGGSVASLLSFPLGTPSTPSYDLLTGVARPILAPGVFGDPIAFSAGFSAVPEPSPLALVVFGCVVVVLRKQIRARRTG